MADDEIRTQAAVYIDSEFRRVHADLIYEHRRQEKRELAFHKSQLESYGISLDIAENRHAARIKNLDRQEQDEAAKLSRQQRSIRGRLEGLTKAGRARQAQAREDLAERFENARFRTHRDLEAFKERHFQAQQADRIMRAQQLKFFRLDNHELRQEHIKQHHATRELKIDARAQEIRRHTAEQALKMEMRRVQEQERTRSRAA